MKCLFEQKTGYKECTKTECLIVRNANCCAACFNKTYCRSMCPWVQEKRTAAEALKKERRKK